MSVRGTSFGSGGLPGAWKRAVDELARKLNLGPFRLFYSKDADVLQLQIKDVDGNAYSAKAEIDRDGNVKIAGVISTNQTLKDYGRS